MDFRYDTDIWDLHNEGFFIVIPTNIGWKRNGLAVMGAGLAKQASKRFPSLEMRYGSHCVAFKDGAGLYICPFHGENLILLPTKPLNPTHPQLSWKNDACPELIKEGLLLLLSEMNGNDKLIERSIAMPLLGAGLGGLKPEVSMSLIRQVLGDDPRIVICDKKV